MGVGSVKSRGHRIVVGGWPRVRCGLWPNLAVWLDTNTTSWFVVGGWGWLGVAGWLVVGSRGNVVAANSASGARNGRFVGSVVGLVGNFAGAPDWFKFFVFGTFLGLGGLLGVLLLALIWSLLEARGTVDSLSIYRRLWNMAPPLLPLGLLFLTAMSVVGDLVESLFKRAAGVKDSSQLLPGHGGVLDRVDALLPTLPLAMMLIAWGNL